MDFYECHGYDLPTHTEPGDYKRVVACLNVWNDLAELEQSVPTWIDYVDHIVAIDGAYEGVPSDAPESTDGTLEYLESLGAEVVRCTDYWPLQTAKRTVYFDRCKEGDLCWHVDADEYVDNAEAIRDTPYLDVGWVRYTSPIYLRPQWTPRVFRWRPHLNYQTRHHWLYEGDKPFCTAQRGGSNLIHRDLEISFHNSRGKLRTPYREIQAGFHRQKQHQDEKKAAPERATGHEPLRILQVGPFDPGAVIYRLHTGINTTSANTSVMATGHQEWFAAPYQFTFDDDLYFDRPPDLNHYHVNYHAPVPKAKWTAIHHHGSVYRWNPEAYNLLDKVNADVRFVSNLELMQYDDNLNWLPNPVPVAEYQRLARDKPRWKKGALIIGHSPTKTKNKATDAFFQAVEKCRAKGLDVQARLIHKVNHTKCLEIKAQCHAIFDSFWLGIQCSGLEGAAMGLPVLAGDHEVQAQYMSFRDRQPYTYANDVDQLVEQMERLATDQAYYLEEAREVLDYTVEYHDTPNVVHQYLEILDRELNWRDNLPMGTP